MGDKSGGRETIPAARPPHVRAGRREISLTHLLSMLLRRLRFLADREENRLLLRDANSRSRDRRLVAHNKPPKTTPHTAGGVKPRANDECKGHHTEKRNQAKGVATVGDGLFEIRPRTQQPRR